MLKNVVTLILLGMSSLMANSSYADMASMYTELKNSCKDPKVEFTQEENLTLYNCWLGLSKSGNAVATEFLAELHRPLDTFEEGEADVFGYLNKSLNLIRSHETYLNYLILGSQQGGTSAKFYLGIYKPPKPYQWKVGMTKDQIRNSINGDPKRRSKTSTAEGTIEIWDYVGALVYFNRNGHAIRIDEIVR